jgi:transcriptional regulator with XRE-family HTH domain
MPAPKLDNYLRTVRKTRGFTQREVAFLLSCHNEAKVSRYELSRRIPTIDTIFAYEVILGAPARELFAGIYERAQRRALHRVRLLRRRLERQAKSPLFAQKVDFLRAVVEGALEEPQYEALQEA